MKTETGRAKRTRSLATTLALAFFSVSVFVLLLSSGLQIPLNFRAQQSALSYRQQLVARDVGETVSRFIENKFTLLETAVEFASPFNIPSDTRQNAVEALLRLHPAFEQFALLDPQGDQVAGVSRASPILSPQFLARLQGEILTQATSRGRFISPLYIADTTSEPLIVIAIPVKSALGEVQGTLVAEVNLTFMWELVDQLKFGNAGYAYVVDAQGNLLAYRDTALIVSGNNVMQIAEVTQFVNNPTVPADAEPQLVSYTGLNGARVVGSYAPMGTPDWAVVVELPWREAYQDALTLGIQSLAIIVSIAILAGLMGSRGSRQFASPLLELSEVADEIAKGNMNTGAKTSGPTEVVHLALAFNTMTGQLRDKISMLEEQVSAGAHDQARQALELETLSAVTREISTIRNIDTLLQVFANLIRERFSLYHTGIYLFDERDEYASLQAASGAAAQDRLQERFRLAIGEMGPFGTTFRSGQAFVAQDIRQDQAQGLDPRLPETISEIILPLRVQNIAIGALDIQSSNPAPLDARDVRTLQLLADQLAAAIENAQLVEQVEGTVTELNRTYRSQTRKAWQSTIDRGPAPSYQFDGRQVRPIPQNLPQELLERLEGGKSIVIKEHMADHHNQEEKQSTLLVPLTVQNQLIGVIGLEQRDHSHNWTDEEMAIAEAGANRAALTLENSRLLRESQRRAAKESTISEATARIGSALNVENILDITAEELERVIGNSEIILQISTGVRPTSRKESI